MELPDIHDKLFKIKSQFFLLREFSRKGAMHISVALGLFLLVTCAGLYYFLISPPSAFQNGKQITIAQDATPHSIAEQFYTEEIIRSRLFFRLSARILRVDTHLNEGIYQFDTSINTLRILYRIGNGEHGIEMLRITFTEGMTVLDMSELLRETIASFDTTTFLTEASTSEGYLFPDTYFILPTETPAELVERLKMRFDEQFASLGPGIAASGKSQYDIVIMASLVEREAKYVEDKHIVADILWSRISKNMPLQVDAVFGYIHSQNGYTPTRKDLERDSPYNTYRKRGLPPTPIANPGLESLEAAATPEKTPYLYYLTGKDGNMHYARTFEEHKRNRVLYLD